jgi:hypothetical protein
MAPMGYSGACGRKLIHENHMETPFKCHKPAVERDWWRRSNFLPHSPPSYFTADLFKNLKTT